MKFFPVALCAADSCRLYFVVYALDIDWRAVEGAEFLIIPADAKVETTYSIFVDPDMGDDETNDGTSRDGPFRSLRRALSRSCAAIRANQSFLTAFLAFRVET